MTICIATDGFPPQTGGIATFNKHLLSLLTSAGHTVIVLHIDYENADEEDSVITEGASIKVLLKKSYHTLYNKWKPYFRPGGFDAPNWIAIGIAMREWLLAHQKQFNIDIIEASDYGGAGIFLCDEALPPVVITGHGSLLQYSRYNYNTADDNYKVVRKLEELSFLHADAVIAHSLLNKTDLENLFPREIRLATIPWFNDAVVTSPPVIPNKLVVVGGMQPIKGVYTMADAITLLLPVRRDLELHWIGGDTWLAPGQQKMSLYIQQKYPSVWQQTFLWKNVQPYTATQLEIETASLIIIPAFFETFNYIALEAAAYKKPILITEGTGASFIFTHGKDAWIVPANDPQALADAIIHLGNDPALCKQLGENAYAMLQRVFPPEKIVADRTAIYHSAIEIRKLKPPDAQKELAFLDTYRTSVRKYYYCIRRFIKKLIGRN